MTFAQGVCLVFAILLAVGAGAAITNDEEGMAKACVLLFMLALLGAFFKI